jgi:hypothetical protein
MMDRMGIASLVVFPLNPNLPKPQLTMALLVPPALQQSIEKFKSRPGTRARTAH